MRGRHRRLLERLRLPVAAPRVRVHSSLEVVLQIRLQLLEELRQAGLVAEVLDPRLLLADAHQFADVRLHEPIKVELERHRRSVNALVADDGIIDPGRSIDVALLVPAVQRQHRLLRFCRRALLGPVAEHAAGRADGHAVLARE